MTKTLDQFLFDRYWEKARCRRLPRQAKDFRWFITDDWNNIKKSRVCDNLYAINGNDKQVVEIDCDGYAFYVVPLIPNSKMANVYRKRGWEEIPEEYYNVEVKDL